MGRYRSRRKEMKNMPLFADFSIALKIFSDEPIKQESR